MSEQEPLDPALRAANLAFSGRHREHASRFASIELRSRDPEHGAWSLAAVISVAASAFLLVLGAWLL